MNNFVIKNTIKSRFLFEYGYLMLAFISVIALISTFIVSISAFNFNVKVLAFTLIVITYVFIFTILHTIQKKQVVGLIEVKGDKEDPNDIFDSNTDEKLLVLEEAGKFFGASLKSEDMFRLISSRIEEIIPFKTCAFYLIDDCNKLFVPFAAGSNSRLFESVKINCSEGIAGRSFLSGKVERDGELMLDSKVLESEFLEGLRSAIAVPLYRGTEVYGVLVLYSDNANNYTESDEKLTEAIGERITPLILGSFSFEKSLSNALTDSITNLPNQRAFYLVLENQVAEAQRFPEQRSLTVLAIDIKNFAEINKKYGHSTGDIILGHTAEHIKTQLRQMDMLARTVNDEFLVVLPTASEGIAEQIIKRLETSFINSPFMISEEENCLVELSFGLATFHEDGETAEQLIRTALRRKHQTKLTGQNSVLFFPKQYLN